MLDWIWIKTALKALVLPPAGLLLVAIVGLLLLRRRPRAGRCLAWLGIGMLAILAMPIVGLALQRAVSVTETADLDAARAAGAIVILGGGIRRDTAEYGGDTLGRLTLERVRYGAVLARKLALPVLVSGGSVLGGTEEATLMRDVLEHELGLSVKWHEPRSRDTRENVAYSVPILRGAGISRVVLVTHAFDMPRARALFSAQGLYVIPAPVGVPVWGNRSWTDWIPSASGLQDSYYALYEIIGNAVRLVTTATGANRCSSYMRAPPQQPAGLPRRRRWVSASASPATARSGSSPGSGTLRSGGTR
jgi:uncharacterized SAM-binding protein YcdF (DUF218 family)